MSPENSPTLSPASARSHQTKKRSPYTRPCDGCSLRKLKCDLNLPSCNRCLMHGLPCTYVRPRKKSSRQIHEKTRDHETDKAIVGSSDFNNKSLLAEVYYNPTIPIECIIHCLQIYQSWFYVIWPLVSVSYLTAKLVNSSRISTLSTKLHKDDISSYALGCAISAALIVQVKFLSTTTSLLNLPFNVPHSYFVKEAIRARESFDYRLNPSPETLLTSFFLYGYYINLKDGGPAAISYLREAISIAQNLGLQNPKTYLGKSKGEVHTLRKIYYMLLVSERFICIEDDMPVILEASIPFPSLEQEEFPTMLEGFTKLVKIFSIPDKKFFDNFMTLKNTESDMKGTFLSSMWIVNVQQELNCIPSSSDLNSTQKLNILLSKCWMQCLTWNISKKNNLLLDPQSITANTAGLSMEFPLEVVKTFLENSKGLPLFAFESNGPGACLKILELGNSLADCIELTNSRKGYDYLSTIYVLVTKLKNEDFLPMQVYKKIENTLLSNRLQLPEDQTDSYISEIIEEEHEKYKDDISPFTQITMAFCDSRSNENSNDVINTYRNVILNSASTFSDIFISSNDPEGAATSTCYHL
ncbi:putative sucrose utilization protein or maltose fermentation regulatory protein [Scheffersomyces xylosifermentans]|uniref:putative sucrose utilization protein or maltose fermentation regulatory protein n=1 Tax=Scheffersomyces xylosifermentans TaxID=1304137 RepID=UPI00315DF59F